MYAESAYIARSTSCNGSGQTSVSFPSVLEDMRYLQDLYRKSDAELILVNNANYPLVPLPPNSIGENVFVQDARNNFVLTSDLMWFELPIGSDQIIVNQP